jgi:hypothetical protein
VTLKNSFMPPRTAFICDPQPSVKTSVSFSSVGSGPKSYRTIEPIAQPDVPYTSKIGNGFAALRHVALGHKHAKCVAANSVLFNHFVGNRKERRRNV